MLVRTGTCVYDLEQLTI